MPQVSGRSLARQLGVLRAAKRAGYPPNRLVRSVLSAVRCALQTGFEGRVAGVELHVGGKSPRSRGHREVFAGARRHVVELGDSLELCGAGPWQLSRLRLNTIIRARTGQDLMVIPCAEILDFSALDGSSLAACRKIPG